MPRKRVAVIGCGASGICAIKTLKEEDIEPVCFEKTNHIGGLWRYHDDDLGGLASIMKTTIINSSKEMSSFTDFPPEEDTANYMHNKHVHSYLIEYARKNEVEKHVHFHKEVIEIDQTEDYDESGRLKVVVQDIVNGEVNQHIFDGVMVCIGHHVYPNMPSFPGMEKFKGTIMHTHSLKSVEQFTDQVVVVVGVGNSGMDAAVEISSVSEQVYLSTRRGTWVLPRLGPWGLPFDLALTRRIFQLFFNFLPFSFICWISEATLNHKFDHVTYNLKPNHRVWSQHPTISDSLPIKLLSGTVKVKKNIKEFVENGVIFEGDDETITECNAIILATGYKIKFPFLNETLTTVKSNKVHLYKYVYPPHLKHPTLAIIGLIQTVGAIFPASETQIRWSSLLLNGKLNLPSKDEMEKDILRKREINEKRYAKSERHTIQVDFIPYLDEINELFGAKPNLFKIFFTDPVLFWSLLLGPSVPYQYKLQGPHSWPGARKAVLEVNKRVIRPLKKDYEDKSRVLFNAFILLFFIILIIAFLLNFDFL